MYARSATQSQPASLLSGLTDRRLATIEKIARSTTAPSTRRPPAAGRLNDRLPDPEALPQPVRQPAGAHRARIQHADLAITAAARGDRVRRIEEPADRPHQAR